MKKLILQRPLPRNPLVAAARFRQAGAHRTDTGAERRQAQMTLRREIEHLPQRRP